MNYDPKRVRPREGWCVVLADERQEKSGNIFLPTETTGLEKVTEGSGSVVRAGAGKKNALLGLEDGVRICYRAYLKHANPVSTEETWPSGAKKEFFILSSDDVLAVLPDGTEVGVFSGRPQVPGT